MPALVLIRPPVPPKAFETTIEAPEAVSNVTGLSAMVQVPPKVSLLEVERMVVGPARVIGPVKVLKPESLRKAPVPV